MGYLLRQDVITSEVHAAAMCLLPIICQFHSIVAVVQLVVENVVVLPVTTQWDCMSIRPMTKVMRPVTIMCNAGVYL